MDLQIKKQLEELYDKRVWEHVTLGEALDNWSKLYGDRVAVVEGDKQLTYKELNSEVKHYAKGLLEKGVIKGDKVVLQLPNSIEFLILSFALFNIGAVPILALPAHRKTEIKGIIEKSEAKIYISKDKYLGFSYTDMIRDILNELTVEMNVYILGNSEEFNSFEGLRSSDKLEVKTEIHYRDVGLLLLSGGTTGIPKLIPRRHCDYLYVAECTGKRCNMNEETVYLAALPMAHNFPLGCPGVIGTLIYGRKSSYLPNNKS